MYGKLLSRDFYFHLYVSVWVCFINKQVPAETEENIRSPGKLELQAAVHHLMCLWGTELRSSVRTAIFLTTELSLQPITSLVLLHSRKTLLKISSSSCFSSSFLDLYFPELPLYSPIQTFMGTDVKLFVFCKLKIYWMRMLIICDIATFMW